MIDARRVGRRIKYFRKLAGLSKSELARRVGVSPTAVHNWEENGVLPRIDVSHALAKALEVSFVHLMTSEDDQQSHSETGDRSPRLPEVSRGERLDQFKRQIAALFDVSPDRVEIVVRT